MIRYLSEKYIFFQELKIRHEQEKEHIIREINENFKDVVENFEINLNKLVKALDNYLECVIKIFIYGLSILKVFFFIYLKTYL